MTSRRIPITVIVLVIIGLLALSFVNSRGNLGNFGITVLSGLFQGMLLFLVASGLSIIFGLMDVLNLAQGAFFMLGAYVAYDIMHGGGVIDLAAAVPDPNVRFVFAILGATLIGAGLGVILEAGLLRPLYSRPIFQLVLTFGVALVMTEAIRAIWSTTPYSWTDLFGLRQLSFQLFEQSFSTYRLFIIGMGFVLIFVIALLLRRTRLGIIIRAGVEDSGMVEALGINVRSVFTLVFMLGCAVAALGGGVAAPFLGASMSLSNIFLVQAIAVVVLGGMGSYEGTAIGSIMVGLSIAVAQDLAIGTDLTVLPSIMPMLLLILILLARPSGLFGKAR